MGVLPLREGTKLLTLTAVVYEAGDDLGKVLALVSMVPVFLIVSFLTTIYVRRQLHTCAMLLGQLLNEALNMVLKRRLRHPRPSNAPNDEFGMPSSHSQFMGFFAAYVVMFACSR